MSEGGVGRAGGTRGVRGSPEPGGAGTGPDGHENLTLVYRRLLSNHETLCKYSNGHVHVLCLWILSAFGVGACPAGELGLYLSRVSYFNQ